MLAAAGIEGGFAMRTGIVGSHVVFNAQLIAAHPTKNGFLVEFYFWPDLVLVVGFFLVAGKTGIVFIATFEFDGDDVQLRMPMHAAGLIVHQFAKDIDSTDLRVSIQLISPASGDSPLLNP